MTKYRQRAPGKWGTDAQFTGRPERINGIWMQPRSGYCTWQRSKGGWYVTGSRNLDNLKARLADLVTYRDAPPEIPHASTTWIPLSLSGKQRELYDLALEKVVTKVNENTGQWTRLKVQNVFTLIGVMRAVCAMSANAFLRSESTSGLGAKQAWFFDQFWPHVRPQDRVVVFCEWTRATRELVGLCKARGITACHFFGGITAKGRDKIRSRWDEGEIQVMVCSPAGYNSINLQGPIAEGAYAYTVMLDVSQWYKVVQRIGRTARTGLKGTPVVLIPFIRHSIEVDWARFAGGKILPDFERLFGKARASEIYQAMPQGR